MVFSTALAGPSRIPLQSLAPSCLPILRRYATAQDEPSTSEDDTPAPGRRQRVTGLEERRGFLPYDVWLREVASEYAHPKEGEKAKWLGGFDTPYATNPSFRPPPPLSNEAQNTLYKQMTTGKQTYEEISAEHGVSKARLDAIRKLKEVEAEFRRQGLPLQTAFQSKMDSLLAAKKLRTSRRENDHGGLAEEADEATKAELEEEHRFEAGIGERGAFGKRKNESSKEGIERTVFEWRSEDAVIEARLAESVEGHEAEEVADQEAFPTPATSRILGMLHKDAKAKPRSHYVKRTATTGFRFIDVSTAGGVRQDYQVKKAMSKREKEKAKEKEREERTKGVFIKR